MKLRARASSLAGPVPAIALGDAPETVNLVFALLKIRTTREGACHETAR
jgi:hypothetical protein